MSNVRVCRAECLCHTSYTLCNETAFRGRYMMMICNIDSRYDMATKCEPLAQRELPPGMS